MTDLHYQIKGRGLLLKIAPFLPENLHSSINEAAVLHCEGKPKEATFLMNEATKHLRLKDRLKPLCAYAIWVNAVDRPLLTVLGILSVPLLILSLIWG